MKERNRGGDRGSRGGREEPPGSKVPAEGAEGSCNRATGRNQAEGSKRGRPSLRSRREMTMQGSPRGRRREVLPTVAEC